MSSGFNREKIRRALERLSDELARRGVRAELFMVGGGAIAMAYSARRVTRDVDAIFEPKTVVYDAARVVAQDLSLPDDWLNDAVKSFTPGDDPERQVVFQTPSLSVSVGSPRYLLAMKLLAARVDQDAEAIKLLYELCSFTTADEGMDLVEALYPGRLIEPKTQFLLEELYGPARKRPDVELEDLVGGGEQAGGRCGAAAAQPASLPDPPVRGAVQCHGRRVDGRRCERLVASGHRCPAHGWQAP